MLSGSPVDGLPRCCDGSVRTALGRSTLVDGPLPLVLLVASLLFAAVVLVYVVLDRTPDWGLLGFAAVIEALTLVLLVVAAVQVGGVDLSGGRLVTLFGYLVAGLVLLPHRLRLVAGRAQPRRHGRADGRRTGAGLRRRPRHAGVAVVSRAAASTSSGLGRALVAVYGVFALAATARSLVQLATKAGEAPLAYALSAVAALVYVAATLGLAEVGPNPRRLAWAAVGFELVGVLTVGTLTVLDPELFPDATVWSDYGAGYGWLPLVLPFVGIAWLWHTRARD